MATARICGGSPGGKTSGVGSDAGEVVAGGTGEIVGDGAGEGIGDADDSHARAAVGAGAGLG